MASVSFENVVKKYGDVTAVDNLNIEVADKEFLVLVGPSGCGKTTALRALAGLEDITTGNIKIGDRIVNDVAPKDRDIAMVFQSYALYPHLSVYDNMAFGLKLRKLPKDEIKRRVNEAADILGIQDFLQRKPRQLSGGQRQRIAIARALLADPRILILDEATSSLDSESEALIQEGLNNLRKGRTTFVIAHRLSTIRSADQILVVEAGEILERGTHDALITMNGRYKQLYDKQYRFEQNLFVNPGEDFTGKPAEALAQTKL